MRPALKLEAHTREHVATGGSLLTEVAKMLGGAAWSATRYVTREAYTYAKKCHWWL